MEMVTLVKICLVIYMSKGQRVGEVCFIYWNTRPGFKAVAHQ